MIYIYIYISNNVFIFYLFGWLIELEVIKKWLINYRLDHVTDNNIDQNELHNTTIQSYRTTP